MDQLAPPACIPAEVRVRVQVRGLHIISNFEHLPSARPCADGFVSPAPRIPPITPQCSWVCCILHLLSNPSLLSLTHSEGARSSLELPGTSHLLCSLKGMVLGRGQECPILWTGSRVCPPRSQACPDCMLPAPPGQGSQYHHQFCIGDQNTEAHRREWTCPKSDSW